MTERKYFTVNIMICKQKPIIGNVIKNGRERCGLSLSQLAAAVRLTEQTLKAMENGASRNTDHLGHIVGYLLRTYRTSCKMDTTELAKQIGVVPSRVVELERGIDIDMQLVKRCFSLLDGITGYTLTSKQSVHNESSNAKAPNHSKKEKKQKTSKNIITHSKFRERDSRDNIIRSWAVDTLRSSIGEFNGVNREEVRSVVFLFSVDDLEDFKIRHDIKGLYSLAIAKRERMRKYIAENEKDKIAEKKETTDGKYRVPRGMKAASQRTTKEWGASARPARIKR